VGHHPKKLPQAEHRQSPEFRAFRQSREQLSSGRVLRELRSVRVDEIEISIVTGSAIIYGATADNTTNDSSIQFARQSD